MPIPLPRCVSCSVRQLLRRRKAWRELSETVVSKLKVEDGMAREELLPCSVDTKPSML